MHWCTAPNCMKRAALRRTMRDPRRNNDLTIFWVCSDVCEWNLIQWLDTVAKKLKIVKNGHAT